MKSNHKFGRFLLRKTQQIEELDVPLDQKFQKLYYLLSYLFQEIIRVENIHLSSLFTKIAYLGNQKKLPRILVYHLHGLRKLKESSDTDANTHADFEKYLDTLKLAIHYLTDLPIDKTFEKSYGQSYRVQTQQQFTQYIPRLHVLVLSIDKTRRRMTALSADAPYQQIEIIWDDAEKNEPFTESILELEALSSLPIAMQLHQVNVTDTGEYLPTLFVFEPSFLIDVTTISNCFYPSGAISDNQFLKKFLTVYPSAAILKGNIANYFLDELVHRPDLVFEDIQRDIFATNPLALSQFDDLTIVKLITELRRHFDHIKQTIDLELTKNTIRKDSVYIEPAFYSPEYGIQGRLDLLHIEEKTMQASIIELKAGKPYRANKYGLNNSHYHQTLLYDLLIRSCFGTKWRLNNFILYSGEDKDQLRYAPSISYQQKEAIIIRNKLLSQQIRMENIRLNEPLFSGLDSKKFPKLRGFAKSDITHFQKVYHALDQTERAYFNHFAAFVARELRLSKVGAKDNDRLNGLSSIWENSITEKVEAFTILNHLSLLQNESDHDQPILVFQKTKRTSVITNFRVGDILVLYPDVDGRQDAALLNQIMKATLLEMTDQRVKIKLRSRQHNHQIFRSNAIWHIEHDRLDNGYHAMNRSLFEFAKSDQRTKDLWLGRRSPQQTAQDRIDRRDGLTEEQHEIFEEIITAEDYYLLWGPPGTGKTSFMVRQVVKQLYENTTENILLLAYTNKAVDEICQAICHISPAYSNRFIRIGSRYSVDPRFQPNLLVEISEKMNRRIDLVTRIQHTRLFVGTVASVAGKPVLFSLQKFDRVIIDEASQLLEPTILGILSRFNKVVLIGDHLQLPAVVQQSPEETEIKNKSLKTLGFRNLANSLFERLYRLCLKNNWYWAIGQLSAQGRMHERIMAFPNQYFYQSQLSCIPSIERLTSPRLETMGSPHLFLNHRLVYVPSQIVETDVNLKMNTDEAQKIAFMICQIQDRLTALSIKKTIGVITPYRAQIANIRDQLIKIDRYDPALTIDTVERFQGGAKDIILMSFCLNHASQLRNLSRLSSDGIDRKLNVALTRARDQIILLGNRALLELNPIYRQLIDSYITVDLDKE